MRVVPGDGLLSIDSIPEVSGRVATAKDPDGYLFQIFLLLWLFSLLQVVSSSVIWSSAGDEQITVITGAVEKLEILARSPNRVYRQ